MSAGRVRDLEKEKKFILMYSIFFFFSGKYRIKLWGGVLEFGRQGAVNESSQKMR